MDNDYSLSVMKIQVCPSGTILWDSCVIITFTHEPSEFLISQLAPLLLFFIWNFHFLLPSTGLSIICFLCLGHFFLSSLPYKLLLLMAQYHNVQKAIGDCSKSMLLPVMCSHCTLHMSFTALWWLQIIYVIFWLMESPYWTMSWIKIGVVSAFPSRVPGTEYYIFVKLIYKWKNEWMSEHRR